MEPMHQQKRKLKMSIKIIKEPKPDIDSIYTSPQGTYTAQGRLTGYVQKGWGYELIFATNDKYCGKILDFNEGAEFSMHFHSIKDESWYVLEGEFEVTYINTKNAGKITEKLIEGSVWRNKPLLPHRLKCIKKGRIIEVSTPDSIEDNYRVSPGDSQKS